MNTVHRLKMTPSDVLIPAAATLEQRSFEARVLTSWANAVDREFIFGEGSALSFLSATLPNAEHLSIALTDHHCLLPFLANALPHESRGALVGIPGLRVQLNRDHMELRLIGAQGDISARIRLLGLSRSKATALLDRVNQSSFGWRPLYQRKGLTSVESVGSRGAIDLDSILSAVLRRFPLWRTADQVYLDLGDGAVTVLWRGSPDVNAVAAVIGNSSCAIPDITVTGLVNRDVNELVIAGIGTERPVLAAEEPWDAWMVLQANQSSKRKHVVVAPRWSARLTPYVWENPEMRNALAARDVSTVYKLLRRYGVSQREIAAYTGQSQSEVSEILKGRQVMAYDVLVRIADGLGVPRGYMGLAYDGFTDAEEPEDLKRRKFLAHAAAVAVGAHALGADEGSWILNPEPSFPTGRIEAAEVRKVEAATRALRSLAYQYGGGFCRDAAVAQVLWAEGLLAHAIDPKIRVRLESAIEDLGELADGGDSPAIPSRSSSEGEDVE